MRDGYGSCNWIGFDFLANGAGKHAGVHENIPGWVYVITECN